MKPLRFILLIGIAVAFAAVIATRWALATLDQPSTLQTAYVYQVPQHARFAQVAADLQARGVVAHPRIWTWYARWQGKAAQIKAGEYLLQPGVTPRKLLSQFIDGQVVLHSFTIVDGWQVRDLLEAMRRSAEIRHTLSGPASQLMATLHLPALHPEGQFLPETYKFPAGTTDVTLLNTAHAALVKTLEAAWAGRDARLPLRNSQELLTLASIVEKETALAEERTKIAGVYVQRLLIGMRLQADPTIIYGLGERYDGDIRSVDLRTDGPYNTYTRAGLPPTPIALPGAAAIQASARPDITGALYFVASGKGDGSHVFSKTYEEHGRAVARYLQILRQHASAAPAPP